MKINRFIYYSFAWNKYNRLLFRLYYLYTMQELVIQIHQIAFLNFNYMDDILHHFTQAFSHLKILNGRNNQIQDII